MTPLLTSVTAERYVKIILKPRGKRDVPARPELLYRCCGVWVIEVLHQAYSHYARTADCDISVTRKVAVYLHCEKTGCNRYRQCRSVLGGVIHRVDVNRDKIGNANLLEEADYHVLCALYCIIARELLWLFELRQKIRRSFNRSCNELREEYHEKRKIHKAALGLDASAIHVDDVRKSLEGVERYTDGKYEV